MGYSENTEMFCVVVDFRAAGSSGASGQLQTALCHTGAPVRQAV